MPYLGVKHSVAFAFEDVCRLGMLNIDCSDEVTKVGDEMRSGNGYHEVIMVRMGLCIPRCHTVASEKGHFDKRKTKKI